MVMILIFLGIRSYRTSKTTGKIIGINDGEYNLYFKKGCTRRLKPLRIDVLEGYSVGDEVTVEYDDEGHIFINREPYENIGGVCL